jgi:hypothetical protein
MLQKNPQVFETPIPTIIETQPDRDFHKQRNFYVVRKKILNTRDADLIHLYLYLYHHQNNRKTPIVRSFNGKQWHLDRGQVVCGAPSLAEQLYGDKKLYKRVYKLLNRLEGLKAIKTEATTKKGSVYSFCGLWEDKNFSNGRDTVCPTENRSKSGSEGDKRDITCPQTRNNKGTLLYKQQQARLESSHSKGTGETPLACVDKSTTQRMLPFTESLTAPLSLGKTIGCKITDKSFFKNDERNRINDSLFGLAYIAWLWKLTSSKAVNNREGLFLKAFKEGYEEQNWIKLCEEEEKAKLEREKRESEALEESKQRILRENKEELQRLYLAKRDKALKSFISAHEREFRDHLKRQGGRLAEWSSYSKDDWQFQTAADMVASELGFEFQNEEEFLKIN